MRTDTILPAALVSVLSLGACGNGRESPTDLFITPTASTCTIPLDQVFDGGPGKDGIPALVDPDLVDAESPEAAYLKPDSRVIGLVVDGQPIAVPLNVGWWHEVVNLEYNGVSLAVTHCPLTGSSLVFDRSPIGNAAFGVSGLLYQNNLIMYDRTTRESLWPQMMRGARCGERAGTDLQMVPAIEMTWAGWTSFHFNTLVVAGDDRFGRDYTIYPYGTYDRIDNDNLLFPVSNIDSRRPLKERVLGIPDIGGTGVAFPYGALDGLGDIAVVEFEGADGNPIVVLWNRYHQTAAAFDPVVDGMRLDLEVEGAFFVDRQTGSHWNVDGHSRSGELSGERLSPIPEAFVAYWFAWAAFHPEAVLWTEVS